MTTMTIRTSSRLKVICMRRTIQAFIAALIAISVPAIAADKTDILIFANGDRLTGDVKSLERGLLRFNTNATGTISIEWDDVAFLSSDQNIQVETANGDRYLGKLVAADTEERIVVATDTGPVGFDTEQVVLMTPIEDQAIDRLDGDVSAGYNFSKASLAKQFRFGLGLDFRTETRIFDVEIDAVTTDSEDNESSQRASVDMAYIQLRPNRWLTGLVMRLDRNDELGLDFRTSLGVGGGRIVHQTNSATLQLIGGVQVSRENISGGDSAEDTLEAYGALTWNWFRYDTPKLDLSTNLQLFPNLTDFGRIRSELDTSFKWEMVEDLFWQLSIYDSFDSDPSLQGGAKNDYGISTSLGYSF